MSYQQLRELNEWLEKEQTTATPEERVGSSLDTPKQLDCSTHDQLRVKTTWNGEEA